MDDNNIKIRKLTNLLFFEKENVEDIKNDLNNKLNEIANSINQDPKSTINSDQDNPSNSNNYGVLDRSLKLMILPNSKYSFINVNLARSFANLKLSKDFSKIKRVFLIAHTFRGKGNKIYLSAYDYYETIFNKKFEIDKEIYENLKNDPQNTIKSSIMHYQINSYNVTYFEEGNSNNRNNIIEKFQSVDESEEDYEFSFDLQLDFLSLLFEKEDIKIVPIWFKSNIKDGKDKLVAYLSGFLNKQLSYEENILICSSNLTYFGRNYNYFGNNKDFKNRTFLRTRENESKVLKHVEELDLEAIELMLKYDEKGFLKITNFNFCKDLFLLMMKLCLGLNLEFIFKNHLCLKFDSRDQLEYELNFCTVGNFIATSK